MAFIELKNVTVEYPILGSNRTLRKTLATNLVGGRLTLRSGTTSVAVTALEDVSFRLEFGDRVGLVGHNGAGKTTLLRVLAGVYAPILGSVHVDGKISALFNQGLGIDMDDSGLDNIRVVGLYLGLTAAEIDGRVEEIVSFSELGDFIHLPMRTYSTGMITRLCFSILTSIEPEILLLDEAINAGDARFEERARERINTFMANSAIIVLASHSEHMIRQICNKAMLFDGGKLIHFGDIDTTYEIYRSSREK